jgi:RAB protein geranylgeranyltransferase component A
LTGFGVYGGFPIIVPLYGGGGELSQAFCRSAAVKGATYILGRDIQHISMDLTNEYPLKVDFTVSESDELHTVRCKNVVRLADLSQSDCVEITRSIAVIEGIFDSLFVPDAQYSDAAMMIIPPETVREEQKMPIQIIVHGGGIGECPIGQCILYSFRNHFDDRDNVLQYTRKWK